jgi:RNA polymerase sigma factor (sigma-70 family)
MADAASLQLVARWRTGDQQAASELFHRYSDRLVSLARSGMSAKLSQRIDPEDVVQSVYRSFFLNARDDRFDLQRGGDLWRLLVAITLHKLQDQVERHLAKKRSVKVELSFGHEAALHGIQADVFSRDPSPIEAVGLAEELEQVMCQQLPLHRRILELRLQGHNHEEIAADTRCSQRTVIRVLKRIKQQLEQLQSS